MLLLTIEDIDQVFTMKDAIEANKKAFSYIASGKCDCPLRSRINVPAYDGCFQSMPAYAEDADAAAVKLVNTFPHNIEKGMVSIPAQVLLMDGKTGYFLALMDGTYVTQLRTGAASGAAFDVLARKDVKKGALIGTGGQAEKQLEAMITARHPEKVFIYDRDADRKKHFTEKMREKLAGYQVEFVAAADSDEAVEDADLLITVTPSRTPVFNAGKIKPGATISCIGSFLPDMQEIDPQIFKRTPKIFFDSRDAVLSESGDMIKPLNEGIITEDNLTGNLGDVINGALPGRENDEEIIIFKTVGIGVQDLMAAKGIYDAAVKAGVGLKWGE